MTLSLTNYHIVLSHPNVSWSLTPLASVNLGIWINASTSWGIGLLVGNAWAAWMLLPGWKCKGCDIGWAECIAVELVVIWLCENSVHDCDITIQSDNTVLWQHIGKGTHIMLHAMSQSNESQFP